MGNKIEIDKGMGKIVPAKRSLLVDKKEYRILDSLGWQPGLGLYAREVETPDGKKIVVSSYRNGNWRFWTKDDRLSPTLKAMIINKVKEVKEEMRDG